MAQSKPKPGTDAMNKIIANPTRMRDLDKFRNIKGQRYIAIYVNRDPIVRETIKKLRKSYPDIKFFMIHYDFKSIIFAHEESWNKRHD